MEWFKVYHGTTTDPKWMLIARKAGVNVATVVAVWLALLEHASSHDERGSTAGFCGEEVDVALGLDDGTTDRVFALFEGRGLVAEGKVASWGKRQLAGKSDAERSREYRARQKGRRDGEVQPRIVTGSNVTERDGCDASRTVTDRHAKIREDKIREEKRREEEKREETLSLGPDTPTLLESSPSRGASAPERETRKTAPRPKIDLRLADFEVWYAAYPRHQKKAEAQKAWEKGVKEGVIPDLETLLKVLPAQKRQRQWQDINFVPQPPSYLNGKQWTDDAIPASPPPPRSSPATVCRPRRLTPEEETMERNQATMQRVLASMREEREAP